MGRADLHMHTNLGDGWVSPARVVREAGNRGLDVIAVTDHDHLEGAKRVEELLDAQCPGVRLIKGVEVSTRSGHLLGLFVTKAPRPMRSVEESIDAIKEQGGLVVVPHPLGRLVPSLSRRRIDQLRDNGYEIDGIEIYNPSPANASQRKTVLEANAGWGLAAIGSSDAHFWQHIGAGYTLFPGATEDELRAAIEGRTTQAGGQDEPTPRLNPGAYVAQCAWSWFVDPPRRMMRRRREASQAAATSDEGQNRRNMNH
ncbi:CehA/McbA family metallohydrolase [Actinoplanes sp. TBRC 11911]|uniref:CehA/McbA family metallohydrolase n=1 Tax=Actinoplanes sp. TBRC 11911 TaxID=2729386 RepID=UPI00145F1CDC|nr:CehA/McbA family metallohydrolase [Actinoplanes sp. TBRC 11911]NMO49717.1 CehA/McbA family metallohydrolase [Actinoplanes sp. TBRC 11911]